MFELETGLIFWTGLSFLVLVFLLYKIVFPPLNRIIDERKAAIEGKLEEAKKNHAEAEELLNKYRLQLKSAEEKTLSMFDEAERKARMLQEESVRDGQLEAAKIIENTKKDVEIFKARALFDFKKEIAEIVAEVNRKLIHKNLKEEDSLDLVDLSIKELEKNA